jgi:hypothetical protein
MNQSSARGVKRQGVDAAFEADESRKSGLILEAQMLRAQHKPEAAADKFAEAAVIEERLHDLCITKGLMAKAFVHGFSAASCWAQAGDFHHAIVLCHALLAHTELPARLRQRIDAYVKTLCTRRAQWYEELVLHDTEYAGS